MTTDYNPLFEDFTGRYGEIPFSKIKTEHYEPAIERGIALARQEIEKIISNPEEPDFENTIVALENAGGDLDRALNVFYPLNSALSDDELMEISLRVAPKLSEYSTSVTLNAELWQRIKTVYERKEEFNLDREDMMLLTETYDSFRRSGALLGEEDREKLRHLNSELTQLTTLFGQNVLKELNTYKIYLKENEITGLPERIVNQAKADADKEGREGEYLFNLSQPVYMSVMKYCDEREVRERFYRLYTGRNIKGEFSNTDIVLKIAALRLEKAKLLGFDTYADLKLSHTMAKTKENVETLLNDLAQAYRPAQLKEFEELNEFASEENLIDGDIKPWDYSYVANKLKEAKYKCDEEKFRPYFPLEAVKQGVFSLAERLYGITFKKVNVNVYHPDVEAFEVLDSDGSYLGLLYTDFFPRESKRPGAWMTDFRPMKRNPDGTEQRPHVSIVMNFTKPHGDNPSLLSTSEVGTFLHEFGHALHGLFAGSKYSSLSGTNVYRDFVELPSQFNENFLTSPEFLETFARHWKTGEMLPVEMIESLVRSRQFGAAYACMRQLGFGILDMKWHTVMEPVRSVEAFEPEAIDSVKVFDNIPGSLISPQFSHIFAGGYAAGYYSYKWAEALDADAFAAFEENGLYDKKTAASFRKNILEKGGSEYPDILYRNFRGRDASISALLKRDGII